MAKRRRTVPSSRRMRTLKAEFWTDPELAELFSIRCRHTYAGLICAYADDHGRELDDLRSIKAAVWRYDDDVTLEDIAEDLTALNVHGKIVRYDDSTSGQRGLRRAPAEKHLQSRQRYLWIRNFKKHNRIDKPTPSRFPPPPADSRIARESDASDSRLPLSGLGIGVGEGSGEGGGVRGGGNNGKGKTRVPHEEQTEGEGKAQFEAVAKKLADRKAMP